MQFDPPVCLHPLRDNRFTIFGLPVLSLSVQAFKLIMVAAPLLSDALVTAADRAVKELDTDSRTMLPPPPKSPTLGAGNKGR
jgi:hypothetical protein